VSGEFHDQYVADLEAEVAKLRIEVRRLRGVLVFRAPQEAPVNFILTKLGDRDIYIPLEHGDVLQIGLTKANGETACKLEWIER
jgi:hypothetical protein